MGLQLRRTNKSNNGNELITVYHFETDAEHVFVGHDLIDDR